MRYEDMIIDEQVLVYKSQYEQDMQTSLTYTNLLSMKGNEAPFATQNSSYS